MSLHEALMYASLSFGIAGAYKEPVLRWAWAGVACAWLLAAMFKGAP